MKEKIINIINDTIKNYNEDLNEGEKIKNDWDTSLYGENSNMDSMDLVSFVVALEQNLEEEFNRSISLADEKAMSQKSSPYKTLNNLLEYILKIF